MTAGIRLALEVVDHVRASGEGPTLITQALLDQRPNRVKARTAHILS